MSEREGAATAEGGRLLTRRLRPQPPKIETRDFRVPPRPYRRIVRELETLSGALGLRLATALSDSLQAKVAVAPRPVRFPSFAVMRGELSDRSWAQPITSKRGDRGLLVFDQGLQGTLLEHQLGSGIPKEDEGEAADAAAGEDAAPEEGGEPAPARKEFRFGFLSRAVMRPTMAVALRELNLQLGVAREASYSIDDAAGKLGLGGYLPDGDACVALDFALAGAAVTGTASVVLPLRPLQTLLRREQGTTSRPPDPRARRALQGLVRGLEMPLAVRVGRAEIAVEEYLRLAAGDVLVLDQSLAHPLDVVVDDVTLFHGRPGRSGGRLAVRITGPAE